ncbi:MAG: hypothetical protein AB3N16_06195 [Flavobacteriaceae bacterium]
MKKSFPFLFLIFSIFSFQSCSLDDDGVNFHYEALKITAAEVPDEFELYGVYDIKVTMVRPDDCTLIEGFDVTKSAVTTRNVVAIGTVLEKEECVENAQEVTQSFKFEVLYTNDYLFRFYTGDDADGDAQFIEVEVPVKGK